MSAVLLDIDQPATWDPPPYSPPAYPDVTAASSCSSNSNNNNSSNNNNNNNNSNSNNNSNNSNNNKNNNNNNNNNSNNSNGNNNNSSINTSNNSSSSSDNNSSNSNSNDINDNNNNYNNNNNNNINNNNNNSNKNSTNNEELLNCCENCGRSYNTDDENKSKENNNVFFENIITTSNNKNDNKNNKHSINNNNNNNSKNKSKDRKRSDPPPTNGEISTVSKPDEDDDDDFVHINICGMKYECLKSTLQRFPDTLLGNKESRAGHFVRAKGAVFFDRNRESFESILYYYQSGGILVRPHNIPMDLFIKEVDFFKLGEKALSTMQENEGSVEVEDAEMPKRWWQLYIWKLFEYPDSSLGARIVASWSLFVIALSITVFCMETMPNFSPGEEDSDRNRQPWFSLELGCIVWFTVEYCVRFISCPSKWQFSKSFLNMVDLLAILPYFITMSVDSTQSTPLSVLRVVRLVRVFRIFKLSRHSLGLQILGHTLRASISELGMLMFFLVLGVILFSSAMYYAETESNPEMFQSIPDAFWYSLVTMTTVGYGDKYPVTVMGKIIGTCCAVTGVLTIALPVPVIVSNFEFYNKRDRRLRERADKRKADDAVNNGKAAEQQPCPDAAPLNGSCAGEKDDAGKELLNGGAHGGEEGVSQTRQSVIRQSSTEDHKTCILL